MLYHDYTVEATTVAVPPRSAYLDSNGVSVQPKHPTHVPIGYDVYMQRLRSVGFISATPESLCTVNRLSVGVEHELSILQRIFTSLNSWKYSFPNITKRVMHAVEHCVANRQRKPSESGNLVLQRSDSFNHEIPGIAKISFPFLLE